MKTSIKNLNKENNKVLKFIKNWQSKNEYKPETLKQYNKKFNIEFNLFLKNNNFSKETINFFTN